MASFPDAGAPHTGCLTEGGHQKRRGGSSVGKAIAIAAGSIRAKGAGQANLWRAWAEYKDVAHLVTAATIICADARRRAKVKPFGGFELDLPPVTIAMMLPDFVLALALSLQEYGLNNIPQSRTIPWYFRSSLMIYRATLPHHPPNTEVLNNH